MAAAGAPPALTESRAGLPAATAPALAAHPALPRPWPR